MREHIPEIQSLNGLFFAIYVREDKEPYTNQEAAVHLRDPEHLNGNIGDIWSGTHPAFNKNHTFPLTAVIELQTGKVIATDPIPQIIEPEEVIEAVREANDNDL